MTRSNTDKTKTILVAPLNWGLGHATRCIPLIKELMTQNIRVILAGNGAAASLLQKEFPQLTILPLSGVNIKYPAGKKGFFFKILWQIPAAMGSIYKEKRWLAKMIEEHKIDAVIADNRMGLHHKKIPCIYITHQLHIKTGGGKWMDGLAQKIHYHFINKFSQCWVPDFEDSTKNLAGELSHPQKMPAVPVRYIGALSRFENISVEEKKHDYLIILSGPEPQRTIFENILLQQIPSVDGKFLVVRGLPQSSSTIKAPSGTTVINHLTADELNKAIYSSSLIISRSGYTTVMDLIKLNKKAILVPTPGQPEQEYLAQHLSVKNFFYTTSQQDFELKNVIDEAGIFSSSAISIPMDLYKGVIKGFVLLLP